MRRKWASCSAEGSLCFSTDLLELEDHDVVDYVIVHESLHLRVPNHGLVWKSLMRADLGDYERLHERLRSKVGSVLILRG
jgi:predicted metal-dependent hydrolase